MATSVICKHVVRSANSTAAEKEILVELASKYETKREKWLLRGGVEDYCGAE